MWKEWTRKPHLNPKPLEKLRIVNSGLFFPHDPIKFLLGWAWASPTLIMTTAPVRGIMVCQIYVCIIYPAFVAPWFPRSVYALKYSVYFSILTCSRAWFTTALDWTARTLDPTRYLPWRLSTKTGRRIMNAQTHGKGFSLLGQWTLLCDSESETTVHQHALYCACCFMTFIST